MSTTPATDIVLRMKTLPDLTNEKAWETIYEGAREIERLRSEIDRLKGLSMEQRDDLAKELRRHAEEAWPYAQSVSNIGKPETDNNFGRARTAMLKAADELARRSLNPAGDGAKDKAFMLRHLAAITSHEYVKISTEFAMEIASVLDRATPPASGAMREKTTMLFDPRDPIEHELKAWIVPFTAMWDNKKNFEFRKKDRDFRVGDTLLIKETWPGGCQYTGRECRQLITFILKEGEFGVPPGYVVMALKSTPAPLDLDNALRASSEYLYDIVPLDIPTVKP